MESSMSCEIHDECGVFGIWSPKKTDLAQLTYYGLFALQHRGQEAAGIAINEDRTIRSHKGVGLVHEVFGSGELKKLGKGQIAVGHVRYSTSGSSSILNAQPMVVRHIKGQLALCHNGNLTNSYELRRKLELDGCIFQTTSDTEVISYLTTRNRLHARAIEEALSLTMSELMGAYSLICMSPSKLMAARDPFGLRPLCFGKTADGCYVFASESCALDAVGAVFIRDLLPGEIIVVDGSGKKPAMPSAELVEKGTGCRIYSIRDHFDKSKHSLCVFEYIYFARSDSVIEGASVHEARRRAGKYLAKEHPADADLVIGVPDSGLDAALGYSEESGIPYGIGLIKNKYIGRTFIAPDQEQRENLVRIKLNAVAPALIGKRVIMIDDSIVRGTTSARIVRLIRDAGAREVHVRISAPPFRNPCFYGTDVDSRKGLIANEHTIPEIAKIIGADSLGFLSVEHARMLVPARDPESFCAACFDGYYPAGTPSVSDKDRFE